MLNRSLFVPFLFGSLIACTPLIAGDVNLTRSDSLQASPTTLVKQSSTALAKTTTIQVEGKPQTIPVDVVQTPHVSTYFPLDRFTLSRGDNNSVPSLGFNWTKPDKTPDDGASIDIYFYGKNASLRDVKKVADFNARILEQSGWRRIEQSPGISYAKRAYSPWIRDVIRFEGKNFQAKNAAATTYVGEVNGQVFFVFSFHLLQNEDEFTPREDVILKNLKVEQGN